MQIQGAQASHTCTSMFTGNVIHGNLLNMTLKEAEEVNHPRQLQYRQSKLRS